jgi:prevent-host-death family protein
MAIIRPVSDLRRHTGELTKLAQESGEPVYLTFRGSKHLVLVDAERYDRLEKRARLLDKKEEDA